MSDDLIIRRLLFDGVDLDADVTEALTDGSMKRTMDGAPTLSITLYDRDTALLRSGIFSKRLTAQIDDKAFELAQVRKTGKSLGLTLEDLAVAEMRRHDSPRKVEKGTMTRIQFARMLLEETPWIPLVVNPLAKAEVTNVELARGRAASDGQEEQREDTWECLKRIFREINWRCYVDNGAVNVGPDSAYIDRGPALTLSENDADLTSLIDFDWDIGKPMASASFSIIASRWAIPPGTPIRLDGFGPADEGLWIVSSVDRSLFSPTTRVEVRQPEPELPEPEDPDRVLEGEDLIDGSGESVAGGAGGKGGYSWPVSGTITSRFGKRGGRQHSGVDIGAPTGRAVVAARAGTVTTAGDQGDYGLAVYITHAKGNSTRYAHLSRITVRRGQKVSAGTKIGEVGSTGRSTGPHLHFEIRINNKAIDPLSMF